MIRPFSISRISLGLLCVFTAAFQTGCEKRTNAAGEESWHFIGQPREDARWKGRAQVTDFDELFKENCLACHSIGKTVSAGLAMDNEVYLSVVSEDRLRDVITNGVEGKLMPAFAIRNGGLLTETTKDKDGKPVKGQIDILVEGILANRKPIPGPLPSLASAPGNAANGETLFNTSFAKGLPASKTFLDPSFLGTVSDQYVRTLVIAGLPALGFPDFRNFVPGRSLTDQEVSDVTAWILSHRTNEYGQKIGDPATQAEPAATPAAVPVP